MMFGTVPPVLGYASRTGTRSTLSILRHAGWHLLVSAAGVWRTEGFAYALDNGAWTAHTTGRVWDAARFQGLIDELGADAEWVVAPDIVAGGYASLHLTESWLPRLMTRVRRVLIAVQDGMSPADVAPLISRAPHAIGVFLGGSTEWKLRELATWGRHAAEWGAYYHVGRVNTSQRIHACRQARAHSFDGTSVVRFPVNLPRLHRAATEPLSCRLR